VPLPSASIGLASGGVPAGYGASGPQGPQGNQGTPGLVGYQGAQGFQGEIGAQGYSGPSGQPGAQGPAGVLELGQIVVSALPTEDPHLMNHLWNDGGNLMVSAG
jgi:hypothetical protein